MDGLLRALLVYDRQDPVEAVSAVLRRLGIRTLRVRNCQQARACLAKEAAFHLVFTDTALPDGSWADVVGLTHDAALGPQVIVVSTVVDVELYMRVLESHAFDFIVPPFMESDLAHVVRCATWNANQHHPQAA